MPTSYTDQFWVLDPYSPPAVGTTLTVEKFELVDQDDDGDIGRTSATSTPDTINGADVTNVFTGDTVTISTDSGPVTYTGTTFYLSDGTQVFTPSGSAVLQEGDLQSTTFVGSTSDLDVSDLGPPCLVAGTRVTTPMGLIPVENLQPGMTITGQNGQSLTLRMLLSTDIAARRLAENPKLRPVCIVSGALGNGLPQRDLWVSRQHRMLSNAPVVARMFDHPSVLVPAIKLTALPGIFVDEAATSVTYYHLVFDQHEIIYAEGAATESLYTGAEALRSISPEAKDELLTLFPEIAQRGAISMKPAQPIPADGKQKNLVSRLVKNGQPVQQ